MIRYAFILLLQFHSFANGKTQWTVADGYPSFNEFGQISAVSVDTADNVYVFHRGDHVWDYATFSLNNIYQGRSSGPIKNETIIVLDPQKGNVKKKAGARKFYMPHGLTVDHLNNIWVTDVALHQVFKFPPLDLNSDSELSQPLLVLGQRFEPGNDLRHFCKPTDVAVDKITLDFYVSDGYCNSRIIKYNKDGVILLSWGRSSYISKDPYVMNVPHALALSVEEKIIFVADRENSRTLSYSTETGSFIQSYQDNRTIYSVAYSSVGGKYLFTLSKSNGQSPGVVTVVDIKMNKAIETFAPAINFSNPHDIAISSDGQCSYVVELNPYRLWKFHRGSEKERDMIEQQASESNVSKLVGKLDTIKTDKAAHEFLGGTLLAIGLVSFVILITFVLFICHIYKKKSGYSQYEMRRLMLDDEDEIGINVS